MIVVDVPSYLVFRKNWKNNLVLQQLVSFSLRISCDSNANSSMLQTKLMQIICTFEFPCKKWLYFGLFSIFIEQVINWSTEI